MNFLILLIVLVAAASAHPNLLSALDENTNSNGVSAPIGLTALGGAKNTFNNNGGGNDGNGDDGNGDSGNGDEGAKCGNDSGTGDNGLINIANDNEDSNLVSADVLATILGYATNEVNNNGAK